MSYKTQDYVLYCRVCGSPMPMSDSRAHKLYCSNACKMQIQRKKLTLRRKRRKRTRSEVL